MARRLTLLALLASAGVHAWLVLGHAATEPRLAAALAAAAAFAAAPGRWPRSPSATPA